MGFGHYYAFIRPNISEDRWYQFNDSQVTEVPKHQALHEGIGGNTSEFEHLKYGNKNFEGSVSQLNVRHFDNMTNAYMLIYIRKTERDMIMSDSLTIDQQIPRGLRSFF